MRLVFFKSAGHKYFKRTGYPGNYRYWYKDPKTGKVYEGDEKGKEKEDQVPVGEKAGKLEKKQDGWWYRGNQKITQDDKKAKEFEEKSKQRKESTGKPELKVGESVRVKPSSKTSGAHKQVRGAIAKIKEIGKDFVRLVDNAGNIWKVNKYALEMAKSNGEESEMTLIKSKGRIKAGHKYWKRTGTSGRYRYWYKTKSGRIIEGKKPEVSEAIVKLTIPIKQHALALKKEKLQKEQHKELMIPEQMKTKKMKRESKKQLMISPSMKKIGKKLETIKIKEGKLGSASNYDQQQLIDLKRQAEDVYSSETKKVEAASKKGTKFKRTVTKEKLEYLKKQIDKKEKEKSPTEKMKVALQIETGKSEVKPLNYNLATISKKQLNDLKKDKKLRNQFVIENQAFINNIAGKVLKQWRSYVFDWATENDAKQDAQLGLILAIDKFNTRKFSTKAFLSYAQKAMTNKMNREMHVKMNRQIKETSLESEVPTSKGEKKLVLGETLKDPVDAYKGIEDTSKYESQLGIIEKMSKEIKSKTARQILSLIKDGWKPSDISRKMNMSRAGVSLAIKRHILPIAKKYLMKNTFMKSFIELLEKYMLTK